MTAFDADTMLVVLGQREYRKVDGEWCEKQSMKEGFRGNSRQQWLLLSPREDAMLDEIVRLRGLVRRAAAKTLQGDRLC